MGSMLSVVVPVYNVAPYLRECLSSIAEQHHGDIEVLMIDDGSTDDSAAIAAEFAAIDSRFRLISQSNQGLGAARNAGAANASGDYLMFIDSDDVIPPYTTELLIASLEQTGSDFATGNVMRLTTRGVHQSALHKQAFAQTKLRTHVSEDYELLNDRTAWNKVFRREFWDGHELRFPEGVLYEDTPAIVPAHVLAKTVDVLDVPIYYWREREGADKSITQRRDEVKGFVDRLAGVSQVSRFLAGQGQKELKRLYDASALRGDLMLFMRMLPRVNDEYRQTFLDLCNEFLNVVDSRVMDSLPASYRLLWTLTRHRMLPEMLELIPRAGRRSPITRRGLRRYHDLPYLDDELPQLPKSLYLAGAPRPRTRVHRASWQDDGKLHLRAHAFIPGQAAARPWSSSRLLWLKAPDGRPAKRVPLVNRRCPDATADFGRANLTYDWSGFETLIDPQALRGADGEWRYGEWEILVGVVGLGQKSQGPLKMGQHANPIPLLSKYVADDVRITPVVSKGRFTLQVERVYAHATQARLVDDYLCIEGSLARSAMPGGERPGVTAQLSRAPGVVWRSYPVEVDGDRFAFRIPVGDLQEPGASYDLLRPGEPGDRWKVDLASGGWDRAVVPVAVHPDTGWTPMPLGARVVHLHRDAAGHLILAVLPAGPLLNSAQGSERGFRFSGVIPQGAGDWSGMELVLRLSSAREAKVFPVEVVGDSWSVEVHPLSVPNFAERIRLRAGTWDLLCRNGNGPIVQLPLSAAAIAGLPIPLANDADRVSLEWLWNERAVIRVRSALRIGERGKAAAARLRTQYYPKMRREPLRDVVVFNSFTGRQYSDSPRAVHEELVARGLPLGHVWVVNDGQAPVPDSARSVALWSREWYEVLATSRYIVTNQHLPEWFRRRDGQVVVQTWHGTPLKRIGFDISDLQFADTAYLEKLETEAPNWSHLVSPNRFSTPILRRAFRYEGEMLEIGYPRNDILFADRERVGARVRAELGLPADRKVVVYAPTWRDDEYYGPGRYKISMQLDLDQAAEQLGDDHVLLIRRHPNVVDEIPRVGEGFVWDVSTYPDMADLLALADILITDYSSVMFDFANTGRPILFFTYDLAHYRDTLRGFYFDFEQEAPGPLLSTSEEVIAAIRDVDAVARGYAERYRAFSARACDLDDGHASARLVQRMLAAGDGDIKR